MDQIHTPPDTDLPYVYYVAYAIAGDRLGFGSMEISCSQPVRTLDDLRAMDQIIKEGLPVGAAPTILNYQLLHGPEAQS